MNRSLITHRYAKAFYSLANEQAVLDQIYKDVNLLQAYCSQVSDFKDLLENPLLKPGQKKKALHAVLNKQVSTYTLNFLNLLLNNNREALLEAITSRFIWLYKQDKGIKEVMIYTAVELNKQQTATIRQFLNSHLHADIELNLKVKPELLGGFILTIDGKMADASLSTKLKEMKEQLLR